MVDSFGQPVEIEYAGSTAGDMHGIYADTCRMQKVLGIGPKYGLTKGLAAMLNGLAS